MKYNYNDKTYDIPDTEIDKAMESLDISLSEACEMWLSDHDLISDETVEKLTKTAQKNRVTGTIHGAKGEKKERKPREKKENPLKKQIIFGIFDYFHDEIGHTLPKDAQISIKNDEKYIDLTIEGREFTINLVEHRKKKV